jgi:phenylacetate-CoA ligase
LREFRVSDFFYPLGLARTHLLLRRSEHWTRTQFEQYQGEKLARLLHHCAEQVPYYGPVFSRLGLEADKVSPHNAVEFLKQLPILDKETLRETPDQFIARNAGRLRPRPESTSGSTGTPLTALWDRGSNVMELCCMQRHWRWAHFGIGQPFLEVNSSELTGTENHAVIDGNFRYLRNWKINALEVSSDFIDEGNIQRYYELLLRYKPRMVRGQPQAIQHLIDLLQSRDLTDWRPRAVTTKGEMLHDFQRRQIEEAWQVPVLVGFGLVEHNVFIAQCPAGSYHISPEYGICEIVDDDGNPTAQGEEGRIVATGLHNYAQPLLRYDTGDFAVAGSYDSCPCGRTLPTVERLMGRIEDYLYGRDGRRYSGMRFAFRGGRGFKKARLVQEDLGRVTVELEVTGDFDQAARAELLNALEARFGDKLVFDIKIVDEIVQETPGKFKFVVSKLRDLETRTRGRSIANG